jgi:ribonucleoside-diphosphate reductase alpha chain
MAIVSAPRSRPDSARADVKSRHTKMDGLRELSKGLKIDAQFCPAELADPFDSVQWELRSAQIKDEAGKLMFEQKDVEIPAGWT